MIRSKSLVLLLPLLAATGARAAGQCLTASCPEGATLFTSAPFEDQITGSVPFPAASLVVAQFDPAFFAPMHGVPPSSITLVGVNADFYGEINPLVQLDSGNSPQACTADWSYDVESVIFTNPAIGNPGILVIVCEAASATLPVGNGPPPPWDVSITPPPATDAFCFADTQDLGAWTGTGQVEFDTDGLTFSGASGCTQLFSSFTNQGLLRVTVTYTYCVDEDAPPDEPGTSFCFGDGTGTACPCGNTGGPGEGCANSTGFGAVLSADGSNSAGADDLTFMGEHLLPNQSALLFAGLNAINGGNGSSFGDGLRCAGGDVRRLGVRIPSAQGEANWGPGLGATGGWVAGSTRRFQIWYRNPTGSPCLQVFNLSNGYEIVFVP